MANQEIKALMAKSKFRSWQIADRIGIAPCTLSVWLRHELNDEKRRRIEEAISSLTSAKEAANE